MCGLAGFVGGHELDLRRMVARLIHRGPDAEGMTYDSVSGVGLGHRRLIILDPEGGAQPMWTADRQLAIVFNGMIYNHRDLRRELTAAGQAFQSHHSDTETLLLAYRAWGPAMVQRLNGMWAFVIFDLENQRLFGSRDRFGQKPLYLYNRADTFAFASELRALTAHQAIERVIDPQALAQYFGYGYVPAPRSIYHHIQKLPAGHSFQFELRTRQFRLERYWCPDHLEPLPASSDIRQLAEEARAKLEQAVKIRLLADVPIGSFLSGGIDSSAVTYFAAQASGAQTLKSFSIGFEDPSFDESSHARLAAQAIGCPHILQTLTWEELERQLETIVGGLDEPMADSSLLPTFMLSQLARQSVTVALSGDGADELFAGYDPFRAIAHACRYYRLVPRRLHALIKSLIERLPVSHRNISLDFKLKKTLAGLDFPPERWVQSWMAPLQIDELSQLLGHEFSPVQIYGPAAALAPQSQPVMRAFTFFYLHQYLQNGVLTKVDRASMMHGLEVRSPFLDKDWVEFALRVPDHFKLRGTTTKYLLKKALEPLLPKSILYRSKKGFGAPIGAWFRQGRLAISTHRTAAYLDADQALAWQQEHRQGVRDHRLFLWCHWVLERFLEREAQTD